MRWSLRCLFRLFFARHILPSFRIGSEATGPNILWRTYATSSSLVNAGVWRGTVYERSMFSHHATFSVSIPLPSAQVMRYSCWDCYPCSA